MKPEIINITDALKKVERLRAEANRIESAINTIRGLRIDGEPQQELVLSDSSPEDKIQPLAENLTGADAIAEILKIRNGKSMKKSHIFTALHAAGRKMPKTSLTFYLSRDDRFENAGRGLWKLKE